MNQKVKLIAGVDEAGRGPLAGPVVAAAVILDPRRPIRGLADSKILSEKKREFLFLTIQEKALSWGLGQASHEEIDALNILQASLLAMQRAVAALHLAPELALVDGNQSPRLSCQTRTIIRGDQSEPAISAASILAKVSRDRQMQDYHLQYPNYGFHEHKGYATPQHLAALAQHGVIAIHRRSFAPVAAHL